MNIRTPTPEVLLPLRIAAALGLFGIVSLFGWLARHRRGLTRLMSEDGVLPMPRDTRSNVIFLACVMTAVATSLLLLLLIDP